MTTSTELNRLIDAARIRLPGALDTIIRSELFYVMDDFFRGSLCWTNEVAFAVAPGTTKYDVVPDDPADGQIATLISVKIAVPYTKGPQVPAIMGDIGTVELLNDPGQASTYTVVLALTVAALDDDDYPDFPSKFLSQYFNNLLDGILGRMMSQPAKPYSSIKLAGMHQGRFESLISRASVDAVRANTYKSQNWRFPRFA